MMRRKTKDKFIFVLNGAAGAGKDTFVLFLKFLGVKVQKESSIDKVKEVATLCGWDGSKTERNRKFLSDLKALTNSYNDMSFVDICKKVKEFTGNRTVNVLCIDIREPDQIERAKKAFGAITVLIENDRVDILTSNESDAHVLDYEYDYMVKNNGSVEDFLEETKKFVSYFGLEDLS